MRINHKYYEPEGFLLYSVDNNKRYNLYSYIGVFGTWVSDTGFEMYNINISSIIFTSRRLERNEARMKQTWLFVNFCS